MAIAPRLVLASIVAILLAHASSADAQVFELIDSFAGCPPEGCGPGDDIAAPQVPLLLGPDGLFYGISSVYFVPGDDGPRSWGTVYRIDSAGRRVILHRFDETGQGCPTNNRLTFGADGALYGLAGRCNGGVHDARIIRITGGTFEVVQTFPADGFTPISIIAGPGGAFYGVGSIPGTDFRVIYKWDGNAITLLLGMSGESYSSPDLVRGPDGNIYFAWMLRFSPGDGGSAAILRISAGDRIEKLHDFGAGEVAALTLVLGGDGALYGVAGSPFVGARVYRVTLAGTFTYLAGTQGTGLLAAGVDGSVFVPGGGSIHGEIVRVSRAGVLTPLHTFDGTDGSGELPKLTQGPDGHLYGVRSEGGAHGVGVFYRIRMPSVDVKANGGDGPISVAPSSPLQISLGFDAAPTTTLSPSEVYVAVVTPTLDVFWMTAGGGFTATPTRLYSGPLTAFAPVPIINIPDAGVLGPGDYYWVTIIDADNNGVPNGTWVDFVKTTRGG